MEVSPRTTLVLTRERVTPDGVFGHLKLPGGVTLCTVEDDWKNNTPVESCIPDGLYPLRRTIFHRKGYETFEICNVPGRSRILIHKGNTEEDIMGCVAVGSAFGPLWIAKDEDTGAAGWKDGVVDSAAAFKTFMYYMRGESEFQILVKWAEGVKPL